MLDNVVILLGRLSEIILVKELPFQFPSRFHFQRGIRQVPRIGKRRDVFVNRGRSRKAPDYHYPIKTRRDQLRKIIACML